MSNFFSIVIPTMWLSDKIQTMLDKYEDCSLVKEIIIIDNNPNKKINLKKYSKLIYYTENKNIFVNPSWNVGNLLSNHRLILANDDIEIENVESVLNLILESDYDIIGVKLGEKNGDMRIDPINQFPKNHFGSFMYVKNYYHIPNNIKIWFGDDLQFDNNFKRGVLINSGINSNESKTVNTINNLVINEVYLQDKNLYNELKPKIYKKKINDNKLSVLAVIVNYGYEQIEYLTQVINELKSFEKYNVTVIVNSNVNLNIDNIDVINLYDNLDDYQLLPITCRKTIWEYRYDYDVFIFGENDHLFKEHHIDKYLEYSEILPKNRIAGLIQYEENEFGKFYPAYHKHYDWDYNSVEIYGGKIFAHFKNVHQATFILTKEQLNSIGESYDFSNFYGPKTHYSVKCRVNTDIYGHSGIKKLICISDFKENLIHHLPNVYINGDKGRNKNQRSEQTRMNNAIIKLFNFDRKKIVCGMATIYERRKSLEKVVNSIIDQVDELYVYQNEYKEIFNFLLNDKIKVISSLDTGINMGDAGKFYSVENHSDCYYLTIDDDIIYPKDYVTSIVEGIKKFNNEYIVTHHGRTFDKNAKNYHTDYVDYVHFGKKLNKHKEIQFPGTGVMGFHTDNFNIKFSDFKYKNIADVIVGVEAGKRNIKCVCLPHDSDWLKDSGVTNQTNLFNQNKTNSELNEFFTKNLNYIFNHNPTLPEYSKKTTNTILDSIGFNPNKKLSDNIDYDKINKLLIKEDNVKRVKIETQNKPKNRQETLELKKNSLSYQANKLKNVRPNRTNLTPNVFGGKKRV